MKILPEKYLRLLSKEDRQSIGQLSTEEALLKEECRDEKALHKAIRDVLGIKGIEFIESAMHRKSTNQRGTPDFLFAVKPLDAVHEDNILYGTDLTACAWELKVGNNDLSTEQKQMFVRLSSPPNCWRCVVIRSVEQAFEELKRYGL